MALYMGDISDLYDWEDGHSDLSNASGVKAAEETRVGTQASFEQILERELAKEQARGGANGGDAMRRRSAASGSKPRQSFLRKGARGWWMEKPEAKQKMQKHTLISVEPEEASSNVRPPPRAQKKTAPRANAVREDAPSNGWNESPRRTSPAAETNGVDLSPVQLPSAQRQDREPFQNTVSRTLPVWASQMDRNGKSTRESVDTTLGMSGVRQEYEARIEQEADELADFEALERQLAAEKASYLREKQEASQGRQYTSFSGFDDEEKDENAHYAAATKQNDYDASWLRESGDDTGSFRDDRSVQESSNRFRRSSHSSLDLGGESSMVFDGDHHVFRSPMLPRGQSRQRPSFAPSEISAVSLNESEPWGDAHALDHFSRLPESPIAKHGMTSVLLNPDGDVRNALSFASNGNQESLWAGRGEDRAFEDFDHVEESFQHFDDYDPVPHSTRRAANMRSGDAPVSSLVQQVFGRGNQWEEEQDDVSVRSYAPSMRKAAAPPSGPVKTTKQKVSSNSKVSGTTKKASAREQAANGGEVKAAPRRRSPGFSAAGTLPVAVEEKLAELEEEVRFYKSETLQLQKKKAHFDEELQKLARQKEAIASFEDEQRRLIEQEWEHERQKMRKEERMFERQVKLKLSAASSAASRKDRVEIDALKAQIVKLQLEAKQASVKSKSTNDVLRQRIAELEGKNRELSEEVKFLEKDRLDQWQKYEELLKELNSQKQKAASERDTLKTVQDVSQIGRTAEQLMSSLGLHAGSASPSSPNEYLSSVASTPTYAHEDTYNPGRYRNTPFFSQSRDQSLFSGKSEVQATETREAASNQDEDRDPTAYVANEVVHAGGKREITYHDGTKKIYFADGNEKEIQPDGHVLIRFTNGDRKEYFPSTGISVYHYFEAQTKLTTYPDKTKVYEFPNQQTEKSYPDGRTEIQFADGIKKIIHPNGDEVSTFPDGTTMLEDKEGMREVTLLNGKKVRYYPNGSMALVGADGQESEVRSDDELKELLESL